MERKSYKFKDKSIFGTTFDAYRIKSQGNLMTLLLDKKIDSQGFIHSGTLSELWSYIYILFLYNRHTIEIFKKMHGVRGRLKSKATAKRFVRNVLEYTGSHKINEVVLVTFINKVIKEDKPVNPLLEFVGKCTTVSKSVKCNDNSAIISDVGTTNGNSKSNSNDNSTDSNKSSVSSKNNNRLSVNNIQKLQDEIDNLKKELSSKENLQKKFDDYTKEYTIKLDRIKNILKHAIHNSSNNKDLEDILKAVQQHIRSLEESKESLDEDKAIKCQMQIQDISNTMIKSKMCLIKYIATIMNQKGPDDDNKCAIVDITKQKEAFNKFSERVKNTYKDAYERNKDILVKYQKQFATMTECNHANLKIITKELGDTAQELTNLLEDLLGSVRVFVRVRPIIPDLDNVDEASKINIKITDETKISMWRDGREMFKEHEFYGVFGPTYSNRNIYTGNAEGLFDINNTNNLTIKLKKGKEIVDVPHYAMMKTFKQLEAGYSLVLSGYGVSGSGKSTTLVNGYKDDHGLLLYGLQNLEGVRKIQFYQAFELYYNHVIPNDLTLVNKIILLHDASRTFKDSMKNYGVLEKDIVSEGLTVENQEFHYTPSNNDASKFIKNVVETCQKHMKSHGRIKTTPLNNASSRSHLFLVFKIEFNSGIESYICLSDMAGMENAYNIYNKIFTKNLSIPFLLQQFDTSGKFKGVMSKPIDYYINADMYGVSNKNTLLNKGSDGKLTFSIVNPKIESSIANNIQIIYESFSVVESLLHMKYFFNKRNNVDKPFNLQKLERGDLSYNVESVFKDPKNEDTMSTKYDKTRNFKSRVLMVPILNYLSDIGGNPDKITKFVMLIALRQDTLLENKNALDFATSISST